MISFEEAEIRAKIIKALSHPIRLMVVDLLKEGEIKFSDICEKFDVDKSTISKHLAILKEVGILSSKKIQKQVIYKLEIPCVIDFFECSTKVIKHNMQRHKTVIESAEGDF